MTEFGNDKSWTQFLKFSYHNLRLTYYQLNYHFRFGRMRLILMPLHLSEDGDTLVFAANNLKHQVIIFSITGEPIEY
ncbi:hypothetical protein MtrunA17_Chr7g0256221 [Medicago truncatula]|nr:hypothetical protein MtrunA17_Chr7g0256221 [Medicago truncatula]